MIAIISGIYVIINQIFMSGLQSTLLSAGSIAVTLIGLPVYMAVSKRKSVKNIEKMMKNIDVEEICAIILCSAIKYPNSRSDAQYRTGGRLVRLCQM